MNKVVHFEIPAEDVARAQKFYKTVFDWKINNVPEMDYTILYTTETDEKTHMIKELGAINGGMMKRQRPVMSPVITIDVPDIEDAQMSIEENGGKIIQERMAVGDMGFSAYFEDSEGNLMGLWENAKKM